MAYWEKLTAAVPPVPSLQAQVAAMTAWQAALARRELPAQPLPRLGITPADYLAGRLAGATDASLRRLDALLRNFRQYIAYHYGMWSFVSQALAKRWTTAFGPQRYLEVAAGNGYLSAALHAAGNAVITTDPQSWVGENVTGRTPLVPVTRAGATAALWRYGAQVDAVVMAWSPDHEPNDAHFLQVMRAAFPQLQLFVIGERFGATNSRLFWQLARFVPDRRLLAVNQALPRFDAINERVYLLH